MGTMLGSIMLFASFGCGAGLALGVLRGWALGLMYWTRAVRWASFSLRSGMSGKMLVRSLRESAAALGSVTMPVEELVVGVVRCGTWSSCLVDGLAVGGGGGRAGLEGAEVGGEGVAFGVGAGEGRHDAVVHEGEAGEHGAGGGGSHWRWSMS